jgi:WD40 repeat protein
VNKHFVISLMFLALFAGSCIPASPTQLSTVTATKTVAPPATPSPTHTATSTSIHQTQEHLLVTRDREHWASLNADGSLQKYIRIPDIAVPSNVSPDGNWLDYESGSYDNEPYDLSLNLLNLDDGTTQFVTNLISPDFPENIGPIVESMSQYDQSLYGDDCAGFECRGALVRDELLGTVGISRWSPNGHFLAFAAQIDGPSTDVYIYSMQDKTIRRLTDDLQNVERMEWSPDGKRLLYTNDLPGILHDGRTFHVVDLEGKTLHLSQEILTKDSQWYMHGWISNNLYLLQALYPEPGQWHDRQLVVVNAENEQLTEIWPYPTSDVVVEISNQTIVLSFYQFFFEDPIPNAPSAGTYFISTNGDREKISDHVFSFVPSSVQIIGIDHEDENAYHILPDGSIKQIGAGVWGFVSSSSPNKKWFFLEQEEREGRYRFSLYDDTYRQIKLWILNEEARAASWRPDSLGIFLFTSDNIYYLAIPDGEPQVLNVEVPPCLWDPIVCTWPEFAWRP